MSARQPLQSGAAAFQQPARTHHAAHRRGDLAGCYTIRQLCDLLHMSRRTFYTLKDAGQLPFLEEIQPRLGRVVRYRASLVDAYLANQFNRAV